MIFKGPTLIIAFGGKVQDFVWVKMIFIMKRIELLWKIFFRENYSNNMFLCIVTIFVIIFYYIIHINDIIALNSFLSKKYSWVPNLLKFCLTICFWWKRLFSTNQMAGNSKTVSLLRKFKNSLFAQWANFLEQRDYFWISCHLIGWEQSLSVRLF